MNSAASSPVYIYQATIINVHDGDTLHLDVELSKHTRGKDGTFGFSVYLEAGRLRVHEDFRLLGLNCAELSTPSGKAALEYLNGLLKPNGSDYVPMTILTVKQADHARQEKFGRFLATLWTGTHRVPLSWGLSVNAKLIQSGHAAPWDGNGPAPVPPWPIQI